MNELPIEDEIGVLGTTSEETEEALENMLDTTLEAGTLSEKELELALDTGALLAVELGSKSVLDVDVAPDELPEKPGLVNITGVTVAVKSS